MNLNDAWLKYMEIIAGNANWIRHAEQIHWRKICLNGISKHEPGNLSLVFHECWMCSSGPSAASVAYSWDVEVGRTSQAWRQKQNEADHTRLFDAARDTQISLEHQERFLRQSELQNVCARGLRSCRSLVLRLGSSSEIFLVMHKVPFGITERHKVLTYRQCKAFGISFRRVETDDGLEVRVTREESPVISRS